MADKRMFNKKITETDAFLEMPATTQLLYFHLNMNADDEGFVSNPKTIMRIVSAKEDDFKILVVKRFVLTFESGVVVIKHWFIHNNIRLDRLKETTHLKEKDQVSLNTNKSYTEKKLELPQPNDNQTTVNGQPSLDKISLEETSKVEISEVEIVGEKPEIVFNEKQEDLSKFLCDKFGVTELRFPQNYMLIRKAITKQINSDKYRWFADQCFYYFKYKEHEEEKMHSLKSFIGDLDNLDGGGWNAENWLKKYMVVKKPIPKANHIQPSPKGGNMQKRTGGTQSLKSIKNK